MYSRKSVVPSALTFSLVVACITLGESVSQDKSCGYLYTEANFTGNLLEIKDSASISNIAETYLTSDSVRNVTKSFKVENGCLLTACNQSYFDGVCKEFSEDIEETPVQFDSFMSVNCTCATECKCSDVHMRKTSCAKAYIKKGCNTCNSYYTDFKGNKSFVPEVFKSSIASILVRTGCSLKIYEEENYNEEDPHAAESIVEGINENWSQTFSSHNCTCSKDSDDLTPKAPKIRSPRSPPFIDIPLSADNISALLDTELGDISGIGKHPGLVAALKSIKGKRSPRNAYILLLGLTGAGKSSAINLLFDHENVTAVGGFKSITSDIHEFRIPVPLDHLGIQNSELRIIDTPGLGDTRGLEQDAKFLATLDDYLDGHEELNKRIPNIVLVFAKFSDNRIDGEGSTFVKMLRGVDLFRQRITDKKFSNVVFVLSHFMSETKAIRRRPGAILQGFKNVIERYSLFPKPISIAVAENKAAEQEVPILNGYYKLPNGDFYPRNLFDKIEFATVNGADPIGEAVIRSAFSDSDGFNISISTFELVNSQHRKWLPFFNKLTDIIFKSNDTEVSQLLATAYESMDLKLKRQFPESLSYLQQSFNVRKIVTKAHIPKTTLDIVKFLRDIKQNEATIFLMETAFGLTAPNLGGDLITGYGYDLIRDRPLLSSPFNLGKFQNSDIGYMIPDGMSCNIEYGSKGIFQLFQNKEDYLKRRLQLLNVEDSVPVSSFKGKVKPGSNIFNASYNENGDTTVSAVKEHRTFQLTLNNKLSLTPAFINTVTNLTKLSSNDHESVESWKKFFNEYGTHVVKSTHGGGSIEITLTSNQTFGPEVAQALFQIIEFAEDVTIGRVKNTSLDTPGTKYTLKFKGGDIKYHTTDLQSMGLTQAAEILDNWKESLTLNPAILISEMQLLPISEVARKIGLNYSENIQYAARELFNQSLIYQPGKIKDVVPGDRYEEGKKHGGLANELAPIIQAMIESNLKTDERMTQLLILIQENNIKQQELQKAEQKEQIEWQRAQIKLANERDIRNQERQIQNDERAANASEKFRLEMKELEERRQAYDREQEIIREERRRIDINNEREDRKRKDESYKKFTMDVIEATRSTSCLKKGTKITMADGSEREVENIQMGDIILDGDLKPTRVIGITFEFLRTQKFYGFEENSYFFTASHLLVGRDNPSGELQFFAKSTEMLFAQNPLMEYLNVQDMKGQFEILKYSNHENKVLSKNVSVFTDPASYLLDTPIYFLQVDNPEGTYIANGYVCRHELPPMENWPKTIGLLFSIVYFPEARLMAQVNYTLQAHDFLKKIIHGVCHKMEGVLKEADYVLEDESDKEILLTDFDTEKAVGDIFANPSISVFAVGLYARCGPALADGLDLDLNSNRKVGTLQKLLSEIAVAEISYQVQSLEFKSLLMV